MQQENQIPALVLREEAFSDFWGDLCSVLVFQYDPGRGEAIRLEGQMICLAGNSMGCALFLCVGGGFVHADEAMNLTRQCENEGELAEI